MRTGMFPFDHRAKQTGAGSFDKLPASVLFVIGAVRETACLMLSQAGRSLGAELELLLELLLELPLEDPARPSN